ncbi:mucin-like protein [Eleutherodactylus coqui]|uniref:mucin-like protein n=1 Tax=Eleutherodactylus coqui TaxID=57060 RepID=UPI00346205E5
MPREASGKDLKISEQLFTDNGVIIFRRTSYDPFYTMRYPYNSFHNDDYSTPPMIAVFWADGDFSTMGELYYQTYDFQASPNQNTDFRDKLESEIKTYFSSLPGTFKPVWAIKITWDQVLPFPSYFFNPSETSTYQAVLVTDGIYSFCLMRFADGEMKWRYYSLPDDYLPKMGYFSGEPSYRPTHANFPAYNDPQTDSFDIPKRYTPDQYIGQNTKKAGYWAYRLEYNTAATTNYRQKCLNWYYKDMDVYPYWMYHTRPCPCSYNQATFDTSYTSAHRLSYYGFPEKSTDLYTSYNTFQTAFSTWYGGGTRCYYNYWGSLSYGEKERYLPTPWEYRNNLQAQRKQYKEYEVDPYNNCCKYSGSSSLCSLYRQRRPYDYCSGYIPPGLGSLFGDPHIDTIDGVKYTFNGLGEFILANVKDENDTVIFRLQGRTARAGNGTQATNFVGLAAIFQNQTTIEWILQRSNSTIVKLNGTEYTLPDNVTYISKITLEKTSGDEIQAAFDGGISITVSADQGALNFITMFDVTYRNRTEGLLGVFNDDKTDDLMAANGTKLEFNGVKLPNESLIFEIGMTWKTTPLDSIFIYDETTGESWNTYNNNTFVPMFYDELLLTSSSDAIDKANQTCQGNDECIFDILSTGNDALGVATLTSFNSATEQNSLMNNFPPNVTGPTTISTKLLEPITVYYTGTDDSNEAVIFSLQTDSSDINITADGMLVWNPTSSTPINVTIVASDTKTTTAVVLTLVLCNCTNNGSCLYDGAITLGDETTTFQVAGCNCSAAWTGMFCEEDFDACAENKCFTNNSCIDDKAPGEGFSCGACPPNLTGDGITCTDINECLNTSICQQICINSLGGYNCSCEAGYEVDERDSSLCVDIDECSNGANDCASNSNCTNLPGNYTCDCLPGYEGNPSILCVDIDECADNTSNCPNQSFCINTNGSYLCQCLPGYSGESCSDTDECLENTAPCPLHSNCTNIPGSYKCECYQGYGGENCTDIDECSTINQCSDWADCNNTEGSYNCACRNGYSGNGEECDDINECSENSSICGENAACKNTNGSYECTCNTGFIRVNGICVDDVECGRPEYCLGRICINTIGSFKCACQPGFREVNDSCIDIDECRDRVLNNCSTNAHCSNVAGSFKCQCMVNYTGDGVTCTVIDECKLNTTYCEHICTSFLGGHICSCNDGYKVNEQNSFKCDDIDECTNETSPCAANATCTNLPGNYSCQCMPGFEGDGMHECTDIDECTNETSPCAANATCINLPGNYSCQCMPGFEGDGMHECTAINTTTESPVTTPNGNGTVTDAITTSAASESTVHQTTATSPVAVTAVNTTTESPVTTPNGNGTATDAITTSAASESTVHQTTATSPVAVTGTSSVIPGTNVTISSPTEPDNHTVPVTNTSAITPGTNVTTPTTTPTISGSQTSSTTINTTTESPVTTPNGNGTVTDAITTSAASESTVHQTTATSPVAVTGTSNVIPGTNVTISSPTEPDNHTVPVTNTSAITPGTNVTTPTTTPTISGSQTSSTMHLFPNAYNVQDTKNHFTF